VVLATGERPVLWDFTNGGPTRDLPSAKVNHFVTSPTQNYGLTMLADSKVGLISLDSGQVVRSFETKLHLGDKEAGTLKFSGRR
jgi:hypothetical protein